MTRPRIVVPDQAQHGVTRVAASLAASVARIDPDADDSRHHVQFTDRLWAASPEEAAARFEAAAAARALTVTLHDLPQPSDGERNLPRRRECYRRVVAAARGVVVSSEHERALLTEHLRVGVDRVAVIPLPVEVEPVEGPIESATAAATAARDVAVLGFFYPGKGHDAALDAAISAGAAAVTVIGRPSPGHERDLENFVAHARAEGMPVEVTGYVPDSALTARCRAAGVPVLAHQHISASGSLATWIAAGRRPVVVRNRYTSEAAALRPGTVTLTDADRLADAVAAALADPASTWVPSGPVPWGDEEVARAHLAWWAEVAW